jgi:hypothetical protein
MQMARQVAGDFYDFIPAPGGQIGVVIADVADKGMAAAIFMALTRSTVRASLAGAASPAEGIARANRLICADAADGMFVTLFYAQLDPATGRLTYVNAGHDPAILCADSRDRCAILERAGLVLGVAEDASTPNAWCNSNPVTAYFSTSKVPPTTCRRPGTSLTPQISDLRSRSRSSPSPFCACGGWAAFLWTLGLPETTEHPGPRCYAAGLSVYVHP